MLTKDALLSSHLAVYVLQIGQFLLAWPRKHQNFITCSLQHFMGDAIGRFFKTKSESIKSATAFLPMSSASIRSLAMPRLLAGTPKDKKYSSLSSKLELKDWWSLKLPLVLILLCIWADWIFHFSALKSCFNILRFDVMSNTPFHL